MPPTRRSIRSKRADGTEWGSDVKKPVTLLALDYGGVVARFIEDEVLAAMSRHTGFDPPTFTERYWAYRSDFDRDHHTLLEYWRLVTGMENPPIDALVSLDLAGWSRIDPAIIRWAKALKEQGLKLALLSNMATPTYEALRKGGHWPTFFDHYIISGILKVNKPDRAIYEHLIAVSDTKPSEILFIDDLMHNIQAAQAAGIHAIRYRGMDDLIRILRKEYPSLV